MTGDKTSFRGRFCRTRSKATAGLLNIEQVLVWGVANIIRLCRRMIYQCAAGEQSMKLLNLWSQNLSVGLAVAACVSPAMAGGAFAQGGNAFKPASFASIKKDASESKKIEPAMATMPMDAAPYPGAAYPMGGIQHAAYAGQGAVIPAGYSMAAMGHGGGCDPSCGVAEQGCAPGCDASMEGFGLLGGNGMHCGPGMMPCGPQCGEGCPCGFGAGLGHGCGPLGCNGGTFGDGRYLRDLFGGCQGRLRGLLASILTPYGEGGVASQRWFDLSADVTAFRRDNSIGNFNFSSQGVGTSNIVLSSNNVSLDDYEAGLALQGNIQCGPGSNLEVGYFGLNSWNQSATVNSVPASSPTLFSYISNFGQSPAGGNGDPPGYDDPDRSFTHSLNYQSTFNNGEVNFRRRWVEPSGFLQGSFLAGIRYFQLDETLTFSARGQNNNTLANNGLRFFDSETETSNQLTGFQVGGDLWANLVPGIKVGTELKTGVYGNHGIQETRIFANSLGSSQSSGVPAVSERASDGRTAYLTQWSVSGIYRLSYSWTMRSSYQLIYVDNVALAPENVNSQAPGLLSGNLNQVRNVTINNDGEVLYTGFTVGAEYNW
jgi:hypothetical protein